MGTETLQVLVSNTLGVSKHPLSKPPQRRVVPGFSRGQELLELCLDLGLADQRGTQSANDFEKQRVCVRVCEHTGFQRYAMARQKVDLAQARPPGRGVGRGRGSARSPVDQRKTHEVILNEPTGRIVTALYMETRPAGTR